MRALQLGSSKGQWDVPGLEPMKNCLSLDMDKYTPGMLPWPGIWASAGLRVRAVRDAPWLAHKAHSSGPPSHVHGPCLAAARRGQGPVFGRRAILDLGPVPASSPVNVVMGSAGNPRMASFGNGLGCLKSRTSSLRGPCFDMLETDLALPLKAL